MPIVNYAGSNPQRVVFLENTWQLISPYQLLDLSKSKLAVTDL